MPIKRPDAKRIRGERSKRRQLTRRKNKGLGMQSIESEGARRRKKKRKKLVKQNTSARKREEERKRKRRK